MAHDATRASDGDEMEQGYDDGDAVEENADTKLYCVCRSFYDEERMMIACDHCDDWYHMVCMDMKDEDADLVDVFVCPNCEKETPQRTTWKPKCHRAECHQAALRPLSRYCSERCGVLMAAHRISLAKATHMLVHANAFARGKAQQQLDKAWVDKLLQIPRIGSAQRREGIVVWSDEVKDRLVWVRTLLGEEAAKHVYELATQGKEAQPDGAPPAFAEVELLDESLSALPQLVEIAQLRVQLQDVQQGQSLVNTTLDTLAARVKLLHLAEDRLATLEPISGEDFDPSGSVPSSKSKKNAKKVKKAPGTPAEFGGQPVAPLAVTRGQPRCGYDERLHWDDTRFRLWYLSPSGKAMLEEEEPLDGELSEAAPSRAAARSPEDMDVDPAAEPLPEPTATICALSKRKCKRHGDWSIVRGADFDLDREQQTDRLAALANEAQRIERRIEKAQRQVKQLLADELDRRRQADERMALALANEGSRRSVPY